MKRPRPGIGTELLPVALILVGLAATLGLVIAAHKNAATDRAIAERNKAAQVAVPPIPTVEPLRTPPKRPTRPVPSPVVSPPRQVDDPTKTALARIAIEEAKQ